MARLQILEYPDPRLRTRAKPVEVFDEGLAKLAADMLETMYAAPGVGLAATQVDQHKRLIVMDVSEDKQGAMVFCNPEILGAEGTGVTEEGCLSVPGIFDEVKRAARVRARAQDVTGKTFAPAPAETATTTAALLIEVLFTLGQSEFGKYHLMVIQGSGT